MFANVSTPFGTLAICDLSTKFYTDRPTGNFPVGVKPKGVAKYSDFGHFQGYILQTVKDCIGKLLSMITNRKSHMRFRLTFKSVTWDDLKRRNTPSGSVISPNSIDFWADYVKLVEDKRILSRLNCRPKNVVFCDISIMVILAAGITFRESVKVRHCPLGSENVTNNQP